MKTVYSLPNCPGCRILKSQLKAEGTPFKDMTIGIHLTIDEFRSKYPDAKSAPFVVEEDEEEDQSISL